MAFKSPEAMSAQKPTLEMFIPEDRRQALARGESLPDRMYGAVLFADLSGFTRLMGVFSAEFGPQRGAETLAKLLDPIYARLVNSIHDYKGSVIVISGDGITCWFDEDDGRRATACAFALQTEMTSNDSIPIPGGQVMSLGIKIALSVGPIQRFLVGDPNIQLIEALAGRELDRVVSIHDVLERGEVAIGQELFEGMKEKVDLISSRETSEAGRFVVVREKAKLTEKDPWLDLPPLEDEVARRWVHGAVYNRIADEEIEFLTELRQAVPLFVKFTGIDYEQDADAGGKLDRFIRSVQSILERYEGYLCQLTIGGKTTNVYIAFGAPLAHEDGVDRALSAAVKLKEETAALGFIQPLQIGMSQGQLWAGAHGGGAARTYSVIGSEVNFAYRLMSCAEPDQILVSPHVAKTTLDYSFTQLSPISFKGIDKPIKPFALIGKTKGHGNAVDQNVIFGRIAERGILGMKLLELTSVAKMEPAGVVLIEGEAGIGKSRLVADFIRQAGQKDISVLYGEADPVESHTQYYAFRSIIESIFKISEEDDPQIIKSHILTSIVDDGFLLERAPLLSEILPLYWPDNELTSQMRGEARALSIMDVVLGLLRKALKGGKSISSVIVLDDAQWMDYATWNLVGYLARQLPETLFVISMRPFQEGEIGSQTLQAYQQLCNDSTTHRLQLSSLSMQEMAGLIEQRLGVNALPGFVIDFIGTRSHGNPFFTEQIAYALRDAGIIRVENGEAVIKFAPDEFSRIDFPATVQGIITSRLDRLSPSQQLTLKVASVIGRVFLLKILANVHPAKPSMDVLSDQLASLNRIGITDLESPIPELSYFFKHVITQEVVYSLLTFAQRQQLHRAIAEWYENYYVEDQSPYYSRLAHHWLHGEVVEKAVYFLDKAGERALELYANEDVVRFISTAMELNQQEAGGATPLMMDSQRIFRVARWQRMLGMAHLNMGHLPESLRHFKEALNLLGRPMPNSNMAMIVSLVLELLVQVLHRVGIKSRPTTNKHYEDELARVAIEEAVFFSQDVTLLAWGVLRRLNLAERMELPALMAEGYSNLVMIAGFTQNERLINLYRRLAWDSVEKSGRTSTRIYALVREGVALYLNCKWDQADENFKAGIQFANQIGDTRSLALLTASQATCYLLRGKYEDALQIWNETYQRAIKKDRPQELAWAYYAQGHNVLMLGKTEEAIRNLEASFEVPIKGAEDGILTTSRYGVLSLAYFRNGQFERAFEQAMAHEKNATPPSSSSLISYYSAIFDVIFGLYSGMTTGGIHLDKSQVVQLKKQMGSLPRSLNAMKNLPPNKAGVSLYKGIHANLMGEHNSAFALWTKSVDYARRFNQPYELARASYELGCHPGLKGSSRRDYLAQACAIFGELGNAYELNLAKTALASLTSESTD